MSQHTCYIVRGGALGIHQGRATHIAGCGATCGGGVQEETMLLAWISAVLQSLPPLPTSKLGPLDADSWVGGFVYVLEPRGSLQ